MAFPPGEIGGWKRIYEQSSHRCSKLSTPRKSPSRPAHASKSSFHSSIFIDIDLLDPFIPLFNLSIEPFRDRPHGKVHEQKMARMHGFDSIVGSLYVQTSLSRGSARCVEYFSRRSHSVSLTVPLTPCSRKCCKCLQSSRSFEAKRSSDQQKDGLSRESYHPTHRKKRCIPNLHVRERPRQTV